MDTRIGMSGGDHGPLDIHGEIIDMKSEGQKLMRWAESIERRNIWDDIRYDVLDRTQYHETGFAIDRLRIANIRANHCIDDLAVSLKLWRLGVLHVDCIIDPAERAAARASLGISTGNIGANKYE